MKARRGYRKNHPPVMGGGVWEDDWFSEAERDGGGWPWSRYSLLSFKCITLVADYSELGRNL